MSEKSRMKGREEAAPFGITEPGSSLWSNEWLIGLLLAAGIAMSYQQVWHAGIIWDDDSHVTRPDLRPFLGLWRIWFKPGATEQYYPVLHSAFWLEHRVWGDSALGYHLANLLFHFGVTILLYRVLRRLAVPGALLAASIFALHPVCVESVAWISEQKNTLSSVFYLAAGLAYLRFDEKRLPGWYAFGILLFGLALLSKSVTATLPAALLVVFWWKRGRLSLKDDVLPLVPWFCMGAASGAVTAWVERTYVGANGAAYGLGILDRFLVAGRAIWFYLGKILWPADLIFMYPHWNVDARVLWQCLFPAAVIAALAALYALRNRTRGPLAAALLFAGTLFPALGFINVYPFIYSYVADHFQYLAAPMVISALAAGFTLAVKRLSSGGRIAARAAAACVVAVLAALTWLQCAMYADMETLWLTTIARNPDCWMAYNNLGIGLLKLGRADEAVPRFQKALEIEPKFAKAHYNIGQAFLMKGLTDEAVAQFQRTLEIEPNNVQALDILGNISLLKGRLDEAIVFYEKALETEPNNSQALSNLGHIFLETGRVDDAIVHFQKALVRVLEIEPNNTVARINLGKALLQKGRMDEAAAQFQKAVEIESNSAEAHFNLGNAFLPMGRLGDAIAHYQRALEINPTFAEAHNNLGNALLQNRQVDGAIAQYRAALEINPNNPEVHKNLGAALVKKGQMDEAVIQFQEALRLKRP